MIKIIIRGMELNKNEVEAKYSNSLIVPGFSIDCFMSVMIIVSVNEVNARNFSKELTNTPNELKHLFKRYIFNKF